MRERTQQGKQSPRTACVPGAHPALLGQAGQPPGSLAPTGKRTGRRGTESSAPGVSVGSR